MSRILESGISLNNKGEQTNYNNVRQHTSLTDSQALQPYQFSSHEDLKEYTISEGVTTIPNNCFEWCNNLEEINIPDSVIAIDKEAFLGCSKLLSISFPKGLKSIGKSAFEFCESLKEIDLPDGISIIEDGLFAACSNLESVDIPNSVERIENNAFFNCNKLVQIHINRNINYLGDIPFNGCNGLKNIYVSKDNNTYESIDGVLFDKGAWELIKYPAKKNAKDYIIPDTVLSIKNCAFEDATELETIRFQRHLGEIGYNAFLGCINLREFTVDDENDSFFSEAGVLFKKHASKEIVIFPANNDLDVNQLLRKVSIVGMNAFTNCKSIKTLFVPGNVWLNSQAFYHCNNLESIIIGEGVEKLVNTFFYDCNNVYKIDIPSSVSIISGEFLNGFQNLKEIVLRVESPEKIKIISYLYSRIWNKCILKVLPGTRWAYRHNTTWSKFKHIEIIDS